ncbi:MAG: cytidine deaminase [Anaerolineae bacterium]|nr:cytidine deaminase [Anaerolineae bacterium]
MDQKTIDLLVTAAAAAREKAYVPYSGYKVGSAVLTRSGRLYTGCNIENASYTPTVCAERVAIFKAVSEGETEFMAIAVVTENGVSPCGVCRQVLAEFMPRGEVVMATTDSSRQDVMTVAELLPRAFGPDDLHHVR